MKQKDIDRFYSKICKEGDHLIWLDKLDKRGYGRFYMNGVNNLAHYISFLFFKGRDPKGYLKHKCDRKDCINVAHLEESLE